MILLDHRQEARHVRPVRRCLWLAVAVLGSYHAIAAPAPALPTAPLTFDTSYERPAGKTINVAAGASLQAAIDSAQPGDIIVVEAGATFTGPIRLRNKTSGTGWIYIQSSQYSSLPAPGTRVSKSHASLMPKIQVAATLGAAIQTDAGAHNYRLVGLEVSPAPGQFVYNVVQFGDNDTTPATLPNHIVIDRSYIHGDPTVGGRRGVAINGAYAAVVDSYIADFKEEGADTQAVWGHNTTGPIKVVNNYLEAAGENVMFGGAQAASEALIPSDIEIRGNHFFKPLSWMGSKWSVKNLLEFKDARRVLVTNNLFENNWLAAQVGFSLLITPRNENGTAPWSMTQDIAITSNQFKNLGSGFNLSGIDTNFGGAASQRTARVLFRDNLMEVTALGGADGRGIMIINGPLDVTIDHNTVIAPKLFLFAENSTPATRVDITNNIYVGNSGSYSVIGTGTGEGLATFTAFFSDYSFTKNVLVSSSTGGGFPAGNYFHSTADAIRFTNAGSGDYSLLSTSPYKNLGTDGRDLGANMASIVTAGSAVVAPRPPANFSIVN